MAKVLFKKFLALSVGLLLSLGQATLVFAQDTVAPSDVEGLEAFPGDEEATLSWDAATDDTGVTGYFVYAGLNSVTEEGGEYSLGKTDVGDVTSYTMENLSNDVTYYFALTAYDAEGNESEFYSLEVEATPESSEVGDFTEPTVSDARAISSSLVEVTFSEDVELPEDGASAFSLEASDGSFLEVLDAYVSSDDPSVVFVVSDVQTAGAEYVLTAGIGITDLSGNPIVSGTSDTAIFTGSALETPAEELPSESPDEPDTGTGEFEILEVEAIELDQLVLTFSEAVTVAEPDSFIIQAEDDATVEVDVTLVEIDDEDPTMVTLTTEEMEAGIDYVLTVDEGVLNEAGEFIAEELRSVDFLSKTLEIADLIAPEDITNLISKALDEMSVELKWTASVNSAGDLAHYLLYQSGDAGATFGPGLELAKDLVSFQAEGLTPGATYTFKVTAVDENGNESEGVLTTVTLPESGPELLALGGLSLLGAAYARRRKGKMGV